MCESKPAWTTFRTLHTLLGLKTVEVKSSELKVFFLDVSVEHLGENESSINKCKYIHIAEPDFDSMDPLWSILLSE